MKKTILRVMYFAVLATLVCIGCGGDDGAQTKSLEIGNLLSVITGGGTQTATYTLTVNVSPTGSGTVSRSKNADSYEHGTQVTVTAKPNNGYEFTGWTGALNSTEVTVTVTMDGDKTLLAGFRRIGADLPQYNVYFNANGATGIPPEMVSSDSGSVISLPGQAGMVKDKYSFAGWNTEADGSGENYNVYGKYTVTRNVALFAQWTRNPYTLTVNVSPTNSGTVSRNPNKETYVHGEQVTVTATPTSGNIFKGWSGASSSTNAAMTITMDDDKTLTAGFGMPNAKQFTVYFNSNGATDGANPPLAALADSGNSITLPGQQTMVKAGYSFSGWNTNITGTGANYSEGSSYTVTSNVTLYARWVPLPKYTLTTNVTPLGGGTVSPNSYANSYDSGTSVTVTAIPTSGYKFTNWSGDLTSNATSMVITMDGNKALTATFHSGFTFTDSRDGKTYRAVKIGNQTWMAENLNNQTPNGSWCYGNNADSCNKYGRLYDWNTARTICPTRWRLPSDQEWRILITAAGGSSVAGRRLKSTNGWNSNNGQSGNGTDSLGFSALPGGACLPSGACFSSDDFYFAGDYGSWWTATEDESGYYVSVWSTYYFYDYVDDGYGLKGYGYSVRCVEGN